MERLLKKKKFDLRNKFKMDMFEKWTPLIKDFPKQIYIMEILLNSEEFRVIIQDRENEESKFSIKFEGFVGFRNFDEGDRICSLDDYPISAEEWGLFKTKKSTFINWLQEENGGRYNEEDLTHYSIFTLDDIFEVICLGRKHPTIEKIR